jgi:hypothetical protein
MRIFTESVVRLGSLGSRMKIIATASPIRSVFSPVRCRRRDRPERADRRSCHHRFNRGFVRAVLPGLSDVSLVVARTLASTVDHVLLADFRVHRFGVGGFVRRVLPTVNRVSVGFVTVAPTNHSRFGFVRAAIQAVLRRRGFVWSVSSLGVHCRQATADDSSDDAPASLAQ